MRRNGSSYVILSEAGYQKLVGHRQAAEESWDRLLADAPAGRRSAAEIDEQLRAERESWDRR